MHIHKHSFLRRLNEQDLCNLGLIAVIVDDLGPGSILRARVIGVGVCV